LLDAIRRFRSFGLSKALSMLGFGAAEGWTPYCEHIGMKMDCSLCPNYVVERRENLIATWCRVARERRFGKK